MGRFKRLVLAGLLAWGGTAAWGQQLFKCDGGYQDRPCADRSLQQRYAAGRFDVEQVNPDTDKDCARSAGELMPFWTRLNAGESIESLRAEYDRKPVARGEKSAMREQFIHLNAVRGTPAQARSQLETHCMAQKRRNGVPTEREIDVARATGASRTSSYDRSYERSAAMERRRAVEAERAAQRAAEAAARAAR